MQRLQVSNDRSRVERDPKVPGLHLRHLRTKSVWYLYYRTAAGIERRPKIGDARIVNRVQARARALAMLAQVAAGGDPAADRRPRAEPTVADLAARYTADTAPRKKPRSQAEEAALWRLHLLPANGALPLSRLDRARCAALHARMGATAPYRANRALGLLHAALRHAERLGWRTGPNPAAVERYPERARRRVPSPDELARLLAALDQAEPTTAALVRLLILTGARLRELLHARRDWIVGAELRLPDSKTGAKVIALSAAALAVIETLPARPGSPYLFPGERPGRPLSVPKRHWHALLQRAGIVDLRMHDLRRLFASVGLSAGLSLEAIGQLLGHRQAQTTKGYAYLQQNARSDAAERVAAALLTARFR